MPNALVIVESPAKAKTINKFLGRGFVVKASMGHVRDLPKRTLGVDEEDFTPTYAVLAEKKKTITELKKAAKNAAEEFRAVHDKIRNSVQRVIVGQERAIEAVSALRTSTIEPLVEGLALEAADVALEYGLAMADAMIYATASRHEAELVTGDADFDGLPRVTLIR